MVVVADSSIQLYNIGSHVGDPTKQLYDIRSHVGEPTRQVYNIGSHVGDPTRQIYNIGSHVGDPTRQVYNIASHVGDTTRQVYGLAGHVGDPIQQIYNIYSHVGDPTQQIYNIASHVGDPTRQVYNIASHVGDPSQQIYNIYSHVGEPSRQVYSIKGTHRSIPDIIWTVGTTGESYSSGYQISYNAVPPYGPWSSMSFAFGVSQTTANSSTLYSVTITMRDLHTWYDPFGVMANVARSGPEAGAPKNWSTTIYPSPFQSTTNAKQFFWGGVSFTSRAPAGVYKFRMDLNANYSKTTSSRTLYDTYSYIYADRSRGITADTLNDWEKKTGHMVFKGGTMRWMADPVVYKDVINTGTPYAVSISAADEILGGVSRTEAPLY